MGFWKDFKAFAAKGSVIDLAVGVIIGAAFGKIVSALVNDVLMPIIGMVTGKGKTFTDKFFVLKAAKPDDVYKSLAEAQKAGANVLAYGDFIQTIIDFLIIALCIFMFVRFFNKMKEKQEAQKEAAPPPGPSSTDQLLMEIRDELKNRSV